MTRHHITRRISAMTVTLLFLSGLLTATAIAKPPEYSGTATPNPAVVSHGGQVRFDVTWTNESGANLPTVNMKSSTPSTGQGAALLAVIDQSQGTCTEAPAELSCEFGTVNAGQTVSISLVYRVPNSGGSFGPTWIFLAQGATGSDGPGKSRGDDMPVSGSVALSSDANLGSSYIFGDNQSVQNDQGLNKKNNPQSAKLNFNLQPGSPGFAASVQEQPPGFRDCPPEITSCFGNWTDVQANNGQIVPNGILVSLAYTSAPGNGSGVSFVHFPSAGGVQLIPFDRLCSTNSAPCINSFSSSQGNYFWEILLESNGPMRGY